MKARVNGLDFIYLSWSMGVFEWEKWDQLVIRRKSKWNGFVALSHRIGLGISFELFGTQ